MGAVALPLILTNRLNKKKSCVSNLVGSLYLWIICFFQIIFNSREIQDRTKKPLKHYLWESRYKTNTQKFVKFI